MVSIIDQPHISEQLASLSAGETLRIKGSEKDFWELNTAVDEYCFEYKDEEIIISMGYESNPHSEIVVQLLFLLKTFFKGQKVKFGNSNRPVCILDCNQAIFNPDGSVFPTDGKKYEYQPGMSAELSPIVLFEVLSKSTRLKDWGEKLPCYKRISSLQHIIYVEQNKLSVTVFDRLPETGKWLESLYEKPEDTFLIQENKMILSEIYEGVEV